MSNRGHGSLIHNSAIVLESNRKYGQPWAAGPDGDSEYAWKVDVGTYAYDFIRKLAENYGYEFGTSGHDNGAVYFSEVRGENRVILEPRWMDNYIVHPYTSFRYDVDPAWWGFGTPPNLNKMKIGTDNQNTGEIHPSPVGYQDPGICMLNSAEDGLYFTENYIRVEKDFKYTFVMWVRNNGVAQTFKIYIDTPVKVDDGLHPWHGEAFYDSSGNDTSVTPLSSAAWTELHLELFSETSGYIRPKFRIKNAPGSSNTVDIDNLGLYMYKRFQAGDNYAPSYRVMHDATTWQFTPDAKAIGGACHTVSGLDSSSDYLEFVIPGVKFDIVSVLGTDGSDIACTYQLYDSSNTITASGYVNQNYTEARYYGDGVDGAGSNPCVTSVTTDLNGTKLPFNYYKFRIKSRDAGSVTRINTVMAYMANNDTVADTFLTGDQGTSVARVTKLSVGTNMPNLRNDILVIGANRGALVIDLSNKDSDVVNENNPIMRRIFSRSTNSDSIYNSNATNYIGFQKQSIVIEPSITSKARADWLSAELVKRHSVMRKTSSWETTGQPLLERNDKVAIVDIGKDVVDSSDEFWITGMSHSMTPSKYLTSFSVTPIEPWDSYTVLPRPYVAADTDIVRNLTVQNQTSGGLVDNDSTNKYNPYTSEAPGGYNIEVKFDLAVDCRIAIGVYDALGDQDNCLTYLTDQTEEDGGWATLAAGTYTYFWDGVDQKGIYNKTCVVDDHHIGKGFYANHYGTNDHGKFYLRFSIFDITTFEITQFTSLESSFNKVIYTQLPAVTVFSCTEQVCKPMATADEWYYDQRHQATGADGPNAPYFYPYFHEDHDQNDRGLKYLFKPETSGRSVFWIDCEVEFWRRVAARVEVDSMVPYETGSLHTTHHKTDVPLKIKYELLKGSMAAFAWDMTKDIFSRDEVLENVSFKGIYDGMPETGHFTRDTVKYSNPTLIKIPLATGGSIELGAGYDVQADRTRFYVAWVLKFKFYVTDRSGRPAIFERYYPWIRRDFPVSAIDQDYRWIHTDPYHYTSNTDKAVNNPTDEDSRYTDFIENEGGDPNTDGVGRHRYKGVLLETVSW